MALIKLITEILNVIGIIIISVSVLVALLLVLRVIINYVTSNPFGWVQYHLRRITEPLVLPIRSQFGGRYMRFDLMPLVMAAIIFMTGSFIGGMILKLAGIWDSVASTAFYGRPSAAFWAIQGVTLAGWLYTVAFLLRYLLPWLGYGYRSPIMRLSFRLTEPLLRPLRRYFVANMFDFSPIIAILLVDVVTYILVSIIISST
jgi:uncharacterized protein YggT (Ycf19 family)